MVQHGTFGGSPQAKVPAIGAYYYNGAFTFFFNGVLDEFRVSNIARSPSDFNLQCPPVSLSGIPSQNSVSLTWQNGGGHIGLLRYRIYRGSDSMSVALHDSTSTLTFADTGLGPNVRYYCRVTAVDSSGFESMASFAAGVTTTALTPAQVSLLSPGDKCTLNSSFAPFVWNKATGNPTSYALYLASDSLFVFQTVDSTLTDTSTVVASLSGGQIYWWRVRAKSSAGWGPYSEKRSFMVSVNGVEKELPLPTEYVLRQNYPNPFNPSTSIQFVLPRSSRVMLAVYDALGNKVATLANGYVDAGYHAVQFDATNLASGVYFYRLQAGGFVDTKKLLLVR